MNLNYSPLERIKRLKPVYRIPYIVMNAHNKCVLDLGCYDETALFKKETKNWLHKAIFEVAGVVLGIDNSLKIPQEGILTSNKSRIVQADVCDIDKSILAEYEFDLIVAGELIEHLPHVLDFFRQIKENFSGKQFICSTPNAISLSNILMGFFGRESTHKDHLQMYPCKALNTLCLKVGFVEWEIIPYHVYFTEMICKTKGIRKIFIQFMEKSINLFENIFPLLSGGLILDVKKI